MRASRLTFQNGKCILKGCWKYEIVAEVQRHYRREFEDDPSTRLIINRIKYKYETNGTVPDVDVQRSGRSRTPTCSGKLSRNIQIT